MPMIAMIITIILISFQIVTKGDNREHSRYTSYRSDTHDIFFLPRFDCSYLNNKVIMTKGMA